MELKSLKFKFKKEDIGRIQKTMPSILVRHFAAVVLAGSVLALLAGLYYFYQDVYVLTREDYKVFVTVREVNIKLLQDVISFIDQNSTNTYNTPPNPF